MTDPLPEGLSLRPVTESDSELLFLWRNDPLTCQNSIHSDLVSIEEHKIWFKESLKNPRRKLFIAEVNKKPVGVIRQDYIDEECELSWTVAPTERGKKIGKTMVAVAMQSISSPKVIAKIKATNIASQNIARFSEFIWEKNIDNISIWKKETQRS